MTIELIDYDGIKVKKRIGKKEDVAVINIEVVSGDEIAIVIYKDYSTKHFDSSDTRMIDFHDDSYNIYDYTKENNLIDNPLWLNRKTSYDDKWRESDQ